MNILVTGAKGMVGTALVANLKKYKRKQKPYPPRYPNRGHLRIRSGFHSGTVRRILPVCRFRFQSRRREPSGEIPKIS